MGDKNAIQIDYKGVWHYWNFGSMMPLCGAGIEDPKQPGMPLKFKRSMHKTCTGYGHIKRWCTACKAIETKQTSFDIR